MSRILRFYGENFKKLRVVAFTPDGHIVRITGKNGAGKTSVLDGVEATLAGGDSVPAKPLRRGTEKGMIRLEIGDKAIEWIVTRRFTEKNRLGELLLETPNGARMPKPQGVLDELRGPGITCDPLTFMRMRPAEQYEMVRHTTPIAVDIDALRGRNKRDYEARTEANTEARRLRGQAQGIVYPADTPAAAPDVAAATQALQGGAQMNTARERRLGERQRKEDLIASLRSRAVGEEGLIEFDTAAVQRDHDELVAKIHAEVEELRRQIELRRLALASAEEVLPAALQEVRQAHTDKAAELRADADAVEAALPEIPEAVDLEALSRVLTSTQQIKEHVDARLRRETLEAEAAALEERSGQLTEAMAARETEIRTAIAAAKMPVENMDFGDNEVLLDGLPLAQASHAEQLRVSAAIAMAGNPKLKIMLVRDGSLLDEDSFQLLAALAEKHDFQLWIEQVETDGRVGVLLEDGSRVLRPGEEPESDADAQAEPPVQGSLV